MYKIILKLVPIFHLVTSEVEIKLFVTQTSSDLKHKQSKLSHNVLASAGVSQKSHESQLIRSRGVVYYVTCQRSYSTCITTSVDIVGCDNVNGGAQFLLNFYVFYR